MSAIGIDARVTGAQRYSVDVERPGMLHAAFVRSPHPHARVRRVDASARARRTASRSRRDDVADLGPLRLPGRGPARARRRGALRRRRRRRRRRADARGGPRGGRGWSRSSTRSCRPSSTRSRRSRPARRCCIPSARRRRPSDAVSIGVRPLAGTNVCHRFRHPPAATSPRASREADVVVEEAFRTPSAAHAPMEPHAALAEWEDGRLTVWTGTQTPFNMRADLAGAVRHRRGARPRRRAADGRLVRRQDVRAHWRRSSPRWRARPGGR